jgi:alkylation response protein AidB-like acyl-CoA dehydrogenase
MNLNEEQRLIRDSVRDYVQQRVLPFAADWDREGRFPAEQLREMAGLGLYGMIIPEEWGGSGADYLSFALAVVCGSLLGSGSDYLKQTYLRPLAAGEMLGCFCLTEPQAGSDAAALETRARRDGDDYVLNGSKAFITSGKNADVAIVFAVSDPAAGKKGISAFVVPTSNPGYQVGGVEQKMGQRASDTAQVFLGNALPSANRSSNTRRWRSGWSIWRLNWKPRA